MTQFDQRNISMLIDLYEIMMANGYFVNHEQDTEVIFDVFYRKNPDNAGFAIYAGLEQVLDYLEHLHFDEDDISYLRSLNCFNEDFLAILKDYHFRGTVYSMKEGTIMYPYEPVLTVKAPLLDAQIIETAVLTQINHQSLIATKTQRIVNAAQGRVVADFGARRAHNVDSAVYGARAAYIGGAVGSATLLAGKMFGIPASGTMAHSFVMFHKDEYTAFKLFAELYPDRSVLLVDTYDVLQSGIPNAIRVAHEVLEPMGKRLQGIRIDSGDLAYLSKEARRMLDDAGLDDCKIVASNSLDEYTIRSLLDQGGCIDSFGVGERLITAKSDPVFGAVYKLAAVRHGAEFEPKIKISENAEKITNPGEKKLWRIYNETGHAVADLITGADETPDFSKPYCYIDPRKPWKRSSFTNCRGKELLHLVMDKGVRVEPKHNLDEIRDYVKSQLKNEIWTEEQRFENPHYHFLDMSPAYYQMKMSLLEKAQNYRGAE